MHVERGPHGIEAVEMLVLGVPLREGRPGASAVDHRRRVSARLACSQTLPWHIRQLSGAMRTTTPQPHAAQ